MNDEFMLVRKSDNAVIISRLILDEGISTMPVMAKRGEHQSFAELVKTYLAQEKGQRASFGKLL